MPEESNIRQATPPKGLLTKSLEGASGLSPKQQIARAYEDDLSGKRGPEARFDALNELIGARVSESMDNMIFSSGDGTQIVGKNGFFTAKSAPSKRSKSTTPEGIKKIVSPWDLAAGEADGSFTIPKPGRIYTSYGDASSLLTIEDADLEFTLGAGDLVWLELTFAGAEANPTVTLKAGNPPTDWPKTYIFTSPPDIPKLTKAYFELYEGKAGTIPPTEFGSQQDGFWLRKSFRYGDSILIWGTHEFDENFTYVPVPILAPR